MKRTIALIALLATATVFTSVSAQAAATATAKASSITRNYITWTFDKEYEVGQFVNGDWWVLGNPVKVVAIDNTLSDKTHMPADAEETHVHGAQINPTPDFKSARFSCMWHGYDSRVEHYREELNAARPGGKPLAKDNPIVLKPNDSLVSMVSWLWRAPDDREPGCPPVNQGGGKYSRPTIRAGEVLTVLDKAPPEGTFRPSFAGAEKRMFNVSQLRRDRLRNLAPIEGTYAGTGSVDDVKRTRTPAWSKDRTDPPYTIPGAEDEATLYYSYEYGADLSLLVRGTARPWIDHIPDWTGGTYLHPALNISNYGIPLAKLLGTAMLALHLDWSKIEGAPKSKDELIINMCQIGIDLAGCADSGTFWNGNGGHHVGRKPAILFAGLLLDDKHMKNVGQWETIFQEDQYTMYITQEHVDKTARDDWKTDTRGIHVAPYTQEMIGMPEYVGYNAGWNLAYRDLNNSVYLGYGLAILMMEDGRKLWNHEAFFDYTDRAYAGIDEATKHVVANRPPAWLRAMWDTYRKDYPSTYDKKWDDEKIIKHCMTERFILVPARPRGFELDKDDPVRMFLGDAVDLSALTPANVTVTTPEGPVTVTAIEPEGDAKNAEYFVIKFPDGALKKGVTYTVTIDKAATASWRNAAGVRFMGNTATFSMK